MGTNFYSTDFTTKEPCRALVDVEVYVRRAGVSKLTKLNHSARSLSLALSLSLFLSRSLSHARTHARTHTQGAGGCRGVRAKSRHICCVGACCSAPPAPRCGGNHDQGSCRCVCGWGCGWQYGVVRCVCGYDVVAIMTKAPAGVFVGGGVGGSME